MSVLYSVLYDRKVSAIIFCLKLLVVYEWYVKFKYMIDKSFHVFVFIYSDNVVGSKLVTR